MNWFGYCEIDKYASKSYSAIHGVPESMNYGDITKIDEKKLPKDIDLITYGFPCQDISLAGKQKGLFNEDGSQTRSGLFFEALRIIEETQPKIAIAENVKNLVGKKFKEQFEIVLSSLEQAGYNNYWKVLNAKDFGIPQNRERVFIVSIRKDIDTGVFEFPEPYELKLRLKDLLEDEVDEKFYVSNNNVNDLLQNISESTGCQVKNQGKDVVRTTDVAGTLLARDYKGFGNQEMTAVVEPVRPIRLGNIYGEQFGGSFGGNVWEKDAIAPTLKTTAAASQQCVVVGDNGADIQKVDIPQVVKVRKYPVDTERLCDTLREYKKKCGWTNKGLAEELELPITTVEHWFRKDDCFAIPEPEVWEDLKYLLEMDDVSEFDESIMTFEEKEGVFEKAERHYLSEGIAPTLTSTSANEKIIVRTNNKKGYDIAEVGDYINIERPKSTTRRGRVGHGVSQTIDTKENHCVVTSEPFIAASRGRNPENPSDRTVGAPTEQRLEPNRQGICNTLTTVQKDNYVVEPTNHPIQIGDLQREGYHEFSNRVYSPEGVARTLMGSGGNNNDKAGQYLMSNLRIRKLTPKECFRLMGFDDADFEKAQAVNSNTQLYKQAGNSIVVDVLEELFCMMFDEEGNFYV